jgi:hypothetical protein
MVQRDFEQNSLDGNHYEGLYEEGPIKFGTWVVEYSAGAVRMEFHEFRIAWE